MLTGDGIDGFDVPMEEPVGNGVDADLRELPGALVLGVLLVVEVGNHGFVDADVDHHLGQVGDLHHLLTLADRLPLSHDRLLRAAATAGLVGDVINDQAVLRRQHEALGDLGFDLLCPGQLLFVDGVLGGAVGIGLDQLRSGLALDPIECASGFRELWRSGPGWSAAL